jgi:hypothetical protein
MGKRFRTGDGRALVKVARDVESMRRETDGPTRRGYDAGRREPRRTGTRAAIVRNAMREA